MFRHFIAYISLIFIFSATAEAAQFAKLPKHIQTHYAVSYTHLDVYKRQPQEEDEANKIF